MKMKSLVLLTVVLLTVALVLAGCKKKEEAPAEPNQTSAMGEMQKQTGEMGKMATETTETMTASTEQTICPVMGNKIDKNVFVEYKGKKVYFCCADCKAKFEADPEKYIAKLPQFQKQ